MYRLTVLIVVMVAMWSSSLVISFAMSTEDKYIRYDEAGLTILREKAKLEKSGKKLLKDIGDDADWHSKLPIMSVMEKKVSPSGGTKHDYVSLSPYYWPDSDKPNGLPYIHKDGQTNRERDNLNRYDTIRLEKMVMAVEFLSTAYYITGNEEYAQRAALWLRTWFLNPKSRMNPNLNFAQGVPGAETGTYYGIIETVELIRIIDAAMMLEKYPDWTAADKEGLRQWFKDYLGWMLDSPFGIQEKNTHNNHGVWYDAQIASFAYYIGDYELVEKVLTESVPQRIQEQIQPDGEMPLEMSRTRSLHYVIYNLRAFITLARLGDKIGINLWDYETEDGRSIKKAIDYVVPYILGEKKWQGQMVVAEKENSAAVYFAMAEKHYRLSEYSIVSSKLLKKNTGSEELLFKTLLIK